MSKRVIKCPYRNFRDCIVEECPSCNYKEKKEKVIEGRYPSYMDTRTVIEKGMAWEGTRTTYEFVSCKLIESGVQPAPEKKEVINNNTRTSVMVKKSIF